MLDVQLFDLHTFLPKPYEEALLPRLKKAHEKLQTGTGLGGRNQEIALSAAQEIAGFRDTAVFSFGSDGTDGPTDAAGGYCDGESRAALAAQGVSIPDVLQQNDAYHGLKKCDGLILTGPTGTNVNDLSVLLIRRQD